MESMAENDVNPSTWGETLAEEIGAAQADLERLDALLADAAATLLESFGAVAAFSAGQSVDGKNACAIPLERAAIALQFQDLASQLIAHTRGRLDACARGMPASDLRQPVGQRALDAGSVELF